MYAFTRYTRLSLIKFPIPHVDQIIINARFTPIDEYVYKCGFLCRLHTEYIYSFRLILCR